MYFRIILIVLALITVNHVFVRGQEFYDRDSLWTELRKAKPDTSKVWLYIQLGQQYETNDPDSALALYQLALQLSEEKHYTRGIISFYTNATYVYNLKGMPDTALVLNLRSVEIARSFGDPERLVACLGNVGASYTSLDQPEKAIDIFLQIIPLLEKVPSHANHGVVYQNLCALYNEIGQPEKAKEHGFKALTIFRTLNSEFNLASLLNNLAMSYTSLGQYKEAIELLNEAREIADRTENQYVAMTTLFNLIDINLQRGYIDGVKADCEEALKLAQKLNDPVSEAIAHRGLAMYYLYSSDPENAERSAQQSLRLALANHTIKHAGKVYGVLGSIAIVRNDFKAHRIYSSKSDSIRNLLLNESIAKNIQNVEAKYDAEKKERTIKDLQKDAQIKDLSIQRNKLTTIALIGSLIFAGLISILLNNNFREKKKLLSERNRLQEARIAQLESEKQVLAGEAVIKGQEEERGRLAKDLHDGLGGMLSGVKFSLANMKSNVVLDADNALVFERSLDMLDHSISELRRVAHNMMPEVLVRFGLSEALKSYCENVRASEVFKIDYQAVGGAERLPEKTEIFIFRIAQELLNNAVKHAQASHVLVQLARNKDEVSVTVEDNGVGFDQTQSRSTAGAGLTSVRSRVDYLKGKIDIQSVPGEGTSVYVTIPIS